MALTHWKNLANYDYLGAYSFEGTGIEEMVLTIKDVKRERVTAPGGNSEDCIVAYFEEKKYEDKIVVKPMVFNKTNCKIIQDLYGPYIENWVGKKVIVYSTTTKFARDVVPCLRIKKEVPQEKVYTCSVCGQVIDKKVYDGSIAKYGVALCGKECLARSQESQNNEKGENE